MIARTLGAAFIVLTICTDAEAATLSPVLDRVHWGDDSAAVARALGAQAMRLGHPIVFGDSYVDVAIRSEDVAGYPFTVYFQMDKTTRRLKRVMFERQRHGANAKVFEALVAALDRDYGPARAENHTGAHATNGYQAATERFWCATGDVVHAVFRDTTLEAEEGCVSAGYGACGLTGHIYVQVTPGGQDCP